MSRKYGKKPRKPVAILTSSPQSVLVILVLVVTLALLATNILYHPGVVTAKTHTHVWDHVVSACSTSCKEAFIFFLGAGANGDGYLIGILVAVHAIRSTGSTRPVIVMHLSNLPASDKAILKQYGLVLYEIPFVANPNCHQGKSSGDDKHNSPGSYFACGRSRENYSKLAAFGWGPLAQYDTLLYMDADTLVLSNLDELFEQPHTSATLTANCIQEKCNNINSGILVIKPNRDVYEDMLSNIGTVRSYNGGDQGFIVSYFKKHSLSIIDGYKYNVKTKSYDRRWCQSLYVNLGKYERTRLAALAHPDQNLEDGGTFKMLHFMDDVKPWQHFDGATFRDRDKSFNDCYDVAMLLWEHQYLALLEELPQLRARMTAERQAAPALLPPAPSPPPPRPLADQTATQQAVASARCPHGVASVVMMNWKRTANVHQIMRTLTAYACVDEFIIWNCHPDTRILNVDNPKVTIIDDPAANDKYGLTTRFKGCERARNEWVLTVDDDLYPTEATVNELLRAKHADTERLYSLHGRNMAKGCSYNIRQPPEGPAQVVLTKVLLADRRFCRAFFEYAPLMEDVAKTAVPYWNGEDIFMSLVSRKVTGNLPIRKDLDYRKLDQMNVGISQHNFHDHLNFRSSVMKTGSKRLGLECA